MALTVKVSTYRDEGEFYNSPLGSQNTMASYVPTSGGGSGFGNAGSYVTMNTAQNYLWGKKIWRVNQTFDASVFVTRDVCINGDLIVGGNLNGGNLELDYLTVNQDVSISGDLWVNGEINGGLFGADVEIGNNLTVGGDCSIFGTLYVIDLCTNNFTTYDTSTVNWYVDNDVCINNYIYVGGGGEFNGDVSMYSDLYVGNDITCGHYISAEGHGTFGLDVSVARDLYVDGSAYFANNIQIDGSINDGNLELNNLHVSNDVSIVGNLWVDGEINGGLFGSNVDIGNNLSVGGDASIVGDLYVSGNNIINEINLKSDITYVDGSLNLKADLTYVNNTFLTDLSLGGLNDTSIGSEQNADVIRYDSSSSKWINQETIDITNLFQSVAVQDSPDSSAYGTPGMMAYDSSYFYVCTEASTWIRILGEGGY